MFCVCICNITCAILTTYMCTVGGITSIHHGVHPSPLFFYRMLHHEKETWHSWLLTPHSPLPHSRNSEDASVPGIPPLTPWTADRACCACFGGWVSGHPLSHVLCPLASTPLGRPWAHPPCLSLTPPGSNHGN